MTELYASLLPGGSRDRPIKVSSASVIEVRAQALTCPHCGVGTYRIVEHAGGLDYNGGATDSETRPAHDDAKAAAVRASRAQRVADQTSMIEYADSTGAWVTERADGHDRPETDVEG